MGYVWSMYGVCMEIVGGEWGELGKGRLGDLMWGGDYEGGNWGLGELGTW